MHYYWMASYIVGKQYHISLQHELQNRSKNKIKWKLTIVYESRQPMVDTDEGTEAESNEYCKANQKKY